MPRPDEKNAVLNLSWRSWPQQLAGAGRLAPGSPLAVPRLLPLTEIVLISVIFFWMAWIATPLMAAQGPRFLPLFLTLLAVIYVAYVSPVLIHQETLASRGIGPAAAFFIRRDNLAEAGLLFGACTLGGILLIVLGGYVFGYGPWFDFSASVFLLRLVLYFLSAFFQDGLFFSFFLRRWQAVFGAPASEAAGEHQPMVAQTQATHRLWWAIMANALVFSLYHLPNLPVMGLALILGIVWGRIFSRTPNVLAAALGHALLGTVLHLCLQVSTKVGSAYVSDHKGFYAVLCPFLEPFIAGRFQW